MLLVVESVRVEIDYVELVMVVAVVAVVGSNLMVHVCVVVVVASSFHCVVSSVRIVSFPSADSGPVAVRVPVEAAAVAVERFAHVIGYEHERRSRVDQVDEDSFHYSPYTPVHFVCLDRSVGCFEVFSTRLGRAAVVAVVVTHSHHTDYDQSSHPISS